MPTESSANPATLALYGSLALLVGMLALLEVGRRLGIRYARGNPASVGVGVGAVESAVFGLLGLFLTFTFYGAGSRFDQRRHLIVEEANAIGTAYLRIDALPTEAQPALRVEFRQYIDARLAIYRSLPDLRAAHVHRVRSFDLQRAIWGQAVAGCHRPDAHPTACMLVLPSLNTMIDITATRTMAAATHPPTIIFVLLFWLGMFAALIAGFGMAASDRRRWLHGLGFAVVLTTAVYVTLDLEHPRFGYIQVSAFDQALREVQAGMQ